MTVGLVLGGARSGKSRFAQKTALALCERPVYLATSRRWDDDHQKRIARHQSDRGPEWITVEEEESLSRAAGSSSVLEGASVVAGGPVVVVDCVTLWLTNFFIDTQQDLERTRQLANLELEQALALDVNWLFVSNELGMAPHAMTESGRKFVDLQGFVNQDVAARADWVVLMVAGLPLTVKGKPPLGAS